MSDRLSKEGRKDLKRPDAFVAWGRKQAEKFLSNGRRVLILVAIILVGAFGWYGYGRYQIAQSEQAWEQFYEATKGDEAARLAGLEKMYQTHGNTRAGSFAAVMLADHYLQLAKSTVEKQLEATVSADKGKKKDSVFEVNLAAVPTEKENSVKAGDWYSKAKQFSGLLPEERQLIEINIGNAQEIAGDLKTAEATYATAAGMSPISKGLAMLGQGRVIEMQGDRERAVKQYQDITKEFSGTEKNREYERLAQSALRRVQSRLMTDGK